MSAGPIKDERDAWAPKQVSTAGGERVCMRTKSGRGYCGRSSAKTLATSWAGVVCADCRAAARADGQNVPDGVVA